MVTGHAELRAWMQRTGRGYLEVADALGISRPHLVHLVTGNSGRTPSLALAGRIAALTGIPVQSWLKPEKAAV